MRTVESWSLTEAETETHADFELGDFVYVWRVPKGKKQDGGPRWNGNWMGRARILAQQRRKAWSNCLVCNNTILYRAAPEHIRPATTREMFLHEVHSANPLPSQLEQVLQNGQVPDGVWTDLLDQDRPPAEAVERLEGNELNKFQENGPESKRRPTRLQLNSNQTRSCSRFWKRKTTSRGSDFINNRN